MTEKTHGTSGIAFGLAAAGAYAPNIIEKTANGPSIMSVVALGLITFGIFAGSLYPDIDHSESILNGDEFMMDWEEKLEHRGVTHTIINAFGVLLPFAIVFALIKLFTNWNTEPLIAFAASFAVGCLWHMVLDSFTPKGVMWLYPITLFRFRIPIVRNYISELIFALVVNIGLLILAANLWAEIF